MSEKFSTVCGYTQEELEAYFPEHIDILANKFNRSREDILSGIKEWYDGYSWDGVTRVYNPFSTLLLFDTEEFSNYWFTSGMPSFLIEQLKEREQLGLVMEPIVASSKTFDSFDPNNIDNVSLLFQSGYLTVKSKTIIDLTPQYTLDTPNREVKYSLMEYLVSLFSFYPLGSVEPLVKTMGNQLKSRDAEGFAASIRIMLQNIPYKLQIGNEKYYHSLFLSWMLSMGFKIEGEVMTGIGQIDAVLELNDLIVVSELKYHVKKKTDTLLNEALKQIHNRRYFEKYLHQSKLVLLMGLAFSGKDVGCRMEEWKN
jgi:hypothetical protein